MSRTLVLATALLALPGGVSAQAQTPPAPGAGSLGGPVIPGLCLLSREAVIANSAVGKAATARLQQLAAEAQSEVENDRKPIDAELQAYQAEAGKLTPEQRRPREQALQTRLAPIQAKAQQRSREIEATRTRALERVSAEAQPVIAQVYTARKCGLLVDRGTVLGGNLANDLTAEVVRTLDAKIAMITFNRETLPAQAPTAPVPRR